MAKNDSNTKKHLHFAFGKIDQENFEELFCYFYPKLQAYAVSILNDKQSAEDVVQDVFLYIWNKREDLQFGEGFYSYIFQSVYSKSIDHIRKDSRLSKHEQDSLLKFAEEYQTYLGNDAHPLKELFSEEFNKKLDDLLDKLPEARKQVFKMVYLDGLKAKEVSSELNMPLRTVESHIYLTLKFLRANLSPTDFLILSLFFDFIS